MNKAIYVGERQSHKTSLAIYRFMEDPENTLLITHNQMMVKSIRDLIQKNFDYRTDNILSAQGLNLGSRNFKKIIFDEFFFWNEDLAKTVYSSAIRVFLQGEGSNLLIYTTLSNQFETNLRQKLTLDQMKNDGWAVINMLGGVKESKEELRSWLFDTPESKITEKTITNELTEVIRKEFFNTNWRKTW